MAQVCPQLLGHPNGRPSLHDRFLSCNNSIDKTIASAISNTFSVANYPYDLRDRLDEFMNRNEKKRVELIQVMNNNNIKIPKYLNSLNGNDKIDEIPF